MHVYVYFILHLLMNASCPYSESAPYYFQGNMDSYSLDSPKRLLHILPTQDTYQEKTVRACVCEQGGVQAFEGKHKLVYF